MNEALVLTATVDPRTIIVNVKDPKQRLLQYVTSALLWAREGPFDRLVFCENSAYPNLDPVRRAGSVNGRSIEVISYDGYEHSKDRGKGYGEAKILEKAFRESKFVLDAWDVWKVTGRLYVPNAAAIREVHRTHRHVMTSDTRYFKTSRNFFWCHLYPVVEFIDDRRPEGYIEAVWGHKIGAMCNGYLEVFRVPVELIGQGGGSGDWYGLYPEWAVKEAESIVDQTSAHATMLLGRSASEP